MGSPRGTGPAEREALGADLDAETERDLVPPGVAGGLASTQAALTDVAGDETRDDPRTVEERVAAVASEPGRRLLDRYDLLRMLGEGGMGEVHECKDLVMDRTVALKSIRRDRKARHLEARFVREACVQAQLEHPSVVPVFEVGKDEAGSAFFTMRKISGVTLDEVLERKRKADPRASSGEAAEFGRHRLLTAFSQICLTVHYAHSRGVLHRDIKPSNVMLGEFGEIYVLDWGLAKLTPAEAGARPSIVGAGAARHQTVAGAALGTPAYMAPEQFAGREIDARADVFALGAMLFEILTLEPLLDESAVEARLRGGSVRWDARPSVRAPHLQIPPEFDRICVRATAEDVDKRYASARALHDVIEAYLDGERDIELRTSLATSLLDRAETTRRTDRDAALREVNRALALAPDDRRALALLVDLLGKTPESLTAKAREEVLAASNQRLRRAQRLGAYIYLLPWLTAYPLLLLRRGAANAWLAATPFVAWVVAFIGLMVDNRRESSTRVIYPTLLVLSAVALTSALFGPLFFVPALATTCVAAHTLVVARPLRWPTIALGCAAVVASMVPVWSGVADFYRFENETTFTMTGVLRTVIPIRLGFVFTLADIILLAGGSYFAYRVRDEIEHARTASVLFAWQLSKLLPANVSGSEEPAPPSGRAKGAESVSRLLDTEIDAEPLRAVSPTTMTRAGGGNPDEADALPLLSFDGSRYVDAELVVEGPSTVVYRVRDRLVGREVAMKRLRPELLPADPAERARLEAAFKREALLQARIEHPAVPPVYDLGADDRGPWFTMKLVPGSPLSDVFRAEGATSKIAGDRAPHDHPARGLHQRLAAFAKVCLAVDFAHEHGVIHDALEPSNVVLGEFGDVYVLGWSHAKTSTTGDAHDATLEHTPAAKAYRAPERDRGAATRQTDIFALGAILFEIAAGQPAASGARIPEVLDEICAKAMAAEPADRYASARDLHDAVESFLGSDRDEALRRGLAAKRLARAEKNLERAMHDEAARVEVLGDIGRALALAPDRTAALTLLSRLLESPPAKLPVEVTTEISEQIWAVARRTAIPTAILYFVLFLVIFPLFSFIVGVRSAPSMVAIMLAWTLATVVVYRHHTRERMPGRTPWPAITALFAVGVTSLLLGPYLLVPSLAITVTMVYILAVHPEWRRSIALLGVTTLLVPAVLVWFGVLDVFELPGEVSTKATIVVRGATYHPPWVFLGALVVTNVLNVLLAGFYAATYRDMLDRLATDNRAKVLGLSRLM